MTFKPRRGWVHKLCTYLNVYVACHYNNKQQQHYAIDDDEVFQTLTRHEYSCIGEIDLGRPMFVLRIKDLLYRRISCLLKSAVKERSNSPQSELMLLGTCGVMNGVISDSLYFHNGVKKARVTGVTRARCFQVRVLSSH